MKVKTLFLPWTPLLLFAGFWGSSRSVVFWPYFYLQKTEPRVKF